MIDLIQGSLPGLFKRTVTLTSGGKLFTNTGWRIAWIIGPEPLIWPLATIFNYALLSSPTPLQIAFAIGMEKEFERFGTPESYFNELTAVAKASRNKLVSLLKKVGADIVVPSAGYAVSADFSKMAHQIDVSHISDMRPGFKFWKFLLIEKVILILNNFYSYYGV